MSGPQIARTIASSTRRDGDEGAGSGEGSVNQLLTVTGLGAFSAAASGPGVGLCGELIGHGLCDTADVAAHGVSPTNFVWIR